MFKEQCSKSHNDKTITENDARTNKNSNSHLDNAATVQMLAELQNILKDKKTSLAVSSKFYYLIPYLLTTCNLRLRLKLFVRQKYGVLKNIHNRTQH